VVVDFNPSCPTQPKVQGIKDPYGQPYADPLREEIDLAETDEVEIVCADQVDVRPFLASQVPALQLADAALATTTLDSLA
jgi:hypothetical protein